MALSWNEIKSRSIKFSKEWEDAEKENAESQSFWIDFFNVFGISQRRVSSFEYAVKKLGNKDGRIDLFWKGRIIVEQKSKGRDLDKAFQQAIDYFPGLKEEELPKYILVSDFENFRLYNLEENEQHDFLLKELHENIKLFGFIAGYQKIVIREEDPINVKAAEKMGKLHDLLKENGYKGHELEIYLVRLLFMLFADDTGIFEKDILWHFIENYTNEDGSDISEKLARLFQVLNTPTEKRQKNLDEIYNQFPYINGKLFEENLLIASFNSKMRQILLESCAMDWSLISPAIFGSLFQSIMDKDARRNLGAHYTSEKNIMKLIKPLFLDELWVEFHKIKNSRSHLNKFHEKISTLRFYDPACGSGNFLIIAYREIREIELKVIYQMLKIDKLLYQMTFSNIEEIFKVNISQFFGTEIDEWAVRIAELAMWLIDHQMNIKASNMVGKYLTRIPLEKSANIIHGNALQLDWNNIIHGSFNYVSADELNVNLVAEQKTHYETLNVKAKNVNFVDEKEFLKQKKKHKTKFDYILGNPPFIGSKLQTTEQRADLEQVFEGAKNAKIMDYVSAWFIKAAKYIKGTKIKVAFVSTNSISQGEQTSVLWGEMLNKYNITINFAHKTFKWSNEAKGQAAVYVIITGFAAYDSKNKTIFDYEDIKGEAAATTAKNINPYLIDAPNLLITKKTKPISNVPEMNFGNMPLDGGNLLFSDTEKNNFLKLEPNAEKFFLALISAREFLNNQKRWCLWLVDASPKELKSMKNVLKRIEAVKKFRLASVAPSTQKHAATPTLFRDRNRPETFIVIPRVSSENRKYIPIGFFDKNSIVSDTMLSIPNGDIFLFGILTSEMHMTWVKYTCGRLKSDFRYSKNIVYNNYPFPKKVTGKQKERVEKAAQKVLDVRAEFPESSLADLYDPLAMPPKLVRAHQQLDKAVDICYRPQAFTNERARIEFLFDLYSQYITPLQAEIAKQKTKKK
ncbi:MAG: hypothetical protein K8R54_11625 [Bacteroidales bacterium]|nr:hypothetical protein [Bacteroidales bacterium]